MFRICVDTGSPVGGSMVLDGEGQLDEFKLPTTPWDFSEGVLNNHGIA